MEHVDVVVVGAGPAGCTVAGEIARTGRSVVLLDKHSGPSPQSRAFGVHAATLEFLDSRGLADELVATGCRVPALQVWGGAGIDLRGLPGRFPFVLVTPQTHVDRLLGGYAAASGAETARSTTVTSVEQDGAGVTVRAIGPGGGRAWRASYVVAADGAHSTVRDLLGVAFPGSSALRSMMLADVRLDDPPGQAIAVSSSRFGFAFIAAFGDGWFRVVAADNRHDADVREPLDVAEIRRIVRDCHGTDFGLSEVRWLSRFHSDDRQVASYRHGRVLLAGDAAHVHSPAGGQGMNTGIQDAANLGWKLAAVVAGADDALLDTYQYERHPVGRTVLRSSGAMIRAMTLRSTLGHVVRDHLAGPVLALRPVQRRAALSVSGLGVTYGGPAPVGTRAADVAVLDSTVAGALRTGGFALVTARTSARPTGRAVVRRRDDGPSLLVRPDGYVAWAGADADVTWPVPVTAGLPLPQSI